MKYPWASALRTNSSIHSRNLFLVLLSAANDAILLALLSALLWGGGDFAGGFATKRASPLQVIILAQGMDALLLLAAILLGHIPAPSHAALLWGFAGGLVNGFGLICLYTALAIAEMGLAAAIAGLLTAALPVLVDTFVEGRPSPRQFVGFLLAGLAVWRITTAPTYAPPAAQKRSLWLAVFAGIGFGFFLVFSRQASREAIVWPLMASRLAGVLVALTLLLLARRNAPAPGARRSQSAADSHTWNDLLAWKPITSQLLWLGVVAGLLDVLGNLCYMQSTTLGRMDVAAVLASLYPAATIVLALVLLRERATRMQLLGMALALTAVGLIAG